MYAMYGDCVSLSLAIESYVWEILFLFLFFSTSHSCQVQIFSVSCAVIIPAQLDQTCISLSHLTLSIFVL